MIGIPVALAASNAAEWFIHKHVLHGLGKRKGSFWSFHWHEHHKNVRRSEHRDEAYRRSVFRWNGQGKEALALAGVAALHLPLWPVAPFYTGTVLYCIANYYRVHKRSHVDVEWAREHLPWHYDHHMGPNQDANWCVTKPWFDQIMGTRIPYLGTEREARDRARRQRAAARAEAAAAQALAG